MNGIEQSIGPDKSAHTSKPPTLSAHSASAPTPSSYSASEHYASAPISSEPSSSAFISSAHTPRESLTRVSASKPNVHADVNPAAPECYVTVVRRSYPKRLNLTSNTSDRVSNASHESGSLVSK